MSRRENAHKRSAQPRRHARPRVLVVCCGERTERDYLDGLRRTFAVPTLRVRSKIGSPAQLVDYARKMRENDPGGFDDVWCVIDVDDFDLGEAVRLARRSGISLAISNPCFEVWLLLHFTEWTGWLAGPTAASAALRRHITCYDKTKLDFVDFAEHVMVAVDRACKIDPSGEDHVRNPSTGMWRLVHMLLDAC